MGAGFRPEPVSPIDVARLEVRRALKVLYQRIQEYATPVEDAEERREKLFDFILDAEVEMILSGAT